MPTTNSQRMRKLVVVLGMRMKLRMRLTLRLFSDHLIGALLCPLQHSPPSSHVPLSAPHYRHQRRPLFGQALSADPATSLRYPFLTLLGYFASLLFLSCCRCAPTLFNFALLSVVAFVVSPAVVVVVVVAFCWFLWPCQKKIKEYQQHQQKQHKQKKLIPRGH